MAEIIVQGICNSCGGTGVDNRVPEDAPPITCVSCAGVGWFTKGEKIDITAIMEELSAIRCPANVFYSYRILEELDSTEYAALTDAQKDGIFHILACGMVDLNDGKVGKTRLWNWFGAESTTVANLTTLLGE